MKTNHHDKPVPEAGTPEMAYHHNTLQDHPAYSKRNLHKEHMMMLLIAIMVLSFISYLLATKLYGQTPENAGIMISVFTLAFINTAVLVIIASILFKMYEEVSHRK